jgi:hypothetical protein
VSSFTIESEINRTSSPIRNIFEFLIDFKNFGSILPQDKVDNFIAHDDGCSFNIKGITTLTVKLEEKKPYEYILYKSEGLAKFNFNLKAELAGEVDKPGQCKIILMAEMNPFIRAMAEKPLRDIVNTMATKLSQLDISSI